MSQASMNVLNNTLSTSQTNKMDMTYGNQLSFEEVLKHIEIPTDGPKRSYTSKLLLNERNGDNRLLESIVLKLEQYIDNKTIVTDRNPFLISTDRVIPKQDGRMRDDANQLGANKWNAIKSNSESYSIVNQNMLNEMETQFKKLLSYIDSNNESDVKLVLVELSDLLVQWSSYESREVVQPSTEKNMLKTNDQQRSMTFPISSLEKNIVAPIVPLEGINDLENQKIIDSQQGKNTFVEMNTEKQAYSQSTIIETKDKFESILSSLNKESKRSNIYLQLLDQLTVWNVGNTYDVESVLAINSSEGKSSQNGLTSLENTEDGFRYKLESLISTVNNENEQSKVRSHLLDFLRVSNEGKTNNLLADLTNKLESFRENEPLVQINSSMENNKNSNIDEVTSKIETLLDSINSKSEEPEALPQLLDLIKREIETEDVVSAQPYSLSFLEKKQWTGTLKKFESSNLSNQFSDLTKLKIMSDESSQNETLKHNKLQNNIESSKVNVTLMDNRVNPQVRSLDSNKKVSVQSSSKFEASYNEIQLKFETLLTQINSKADISRFSPKILELLKQFNELQNNGLAQNLDQSGGTQTREQRIWTDILQSFQRRDNLLIKQQYQINSVVTSRDLTKWLEKALDKYGFDEKQVLFPSGAPLSKMEQYVIHVNPNNDAKLANQELLQQFQTITKSSKFLANPNGMNQMSIVLRPDHLGEMRIRLLQINGELTVRIVVSTQAAKELLETNMNQLRHMFSPHQVTVEKQDLSLQQESLLNRDGKDDHWKENNEEHSNPSEKDGNNSSEENKELDFNELLMNLKI